MARADDGVGTIETILLPVVPLVDLCLFPESSLTLQAPRPGAARALAIARRTGRRLLAIAQKDPDSDPAGNLHELGTVAHLTFLDGSEDAAAKVELDGLYRARIVSLFEGATIAAEVARLEEGDPGDDWGAAVEALARYLHGHGNLRAFLEAQPRSNEPMAWVNLACQHLPITSTARQKLLESDAAGRCQKISRGLDALLLKERIDKGART